jgi:CRP-like cAMP-binding protein
MITPETVRGLAVFEALDDDAVAFVCSAAADMHLRAGDWFIYEGEAAAFFVLLEGSFEVLKRYGTTLRQLAIRGPGDYMGEIPSVLDGPFIAAAKTLEPSRVMRLDVRDFKRLLVLVPSFRERVFETILHRIEGIEEEAAILEGAPVVIPLATRSAIFSRAIGRRSNGSIPMTAVFASARGRCLATTCRSFCLPMDADSCARRSSSSPKVSR